MKVLFIRMENVLHDFYELSYVQALNAYQSFPEIELHIANTRTWQECITKNRYDLVLVYHSMQINPLDIVYYVPSETITAWISCEDPYDFDASLIHAKCYDLTFTIEEACLPYYKEMGIRAVYLPHALNKGIHKPYGNIPMDYDISFVGAPFKKRVELINSAKDLFLRCRFAIFGDKDWIEKGLDEELHPFLVHRISQEEAARVYSSSMYSLNIHRAGRDPDTGLNSRGIEPISPNDRHFAIWGCGGVEIEDPRELNLEDMSMDSMFYKSEKFKVGWWIIHKREKNTYEARVKQILEEVEKYREERRHQDGLIR